MKINLETTSKLDSSAHAEEAESNLVEESKVHEKLEFISAQAVVEFKVGACHYAISRHALKPETIRDTFFERCLSDEWMPEDGIIRIEREGSIFRFILFFLEFGFLPTDKYAQCVLDASTLKDLATEADFYAMPQLVDECTRLLSHPSDVEDFYTHGGGILTTSSKPQQLPINLPWECMYSSEDPDDLVNTLESFFKPFCVSGEVDWEEIFEEEEALFKSSTLDVLNVPELIESAKPSCFGKGPETVFDPEVRNSLEIAAKKLNLDLLEELGDSFDLNELSHSIYFDVKPYKLVIYQEGGHFGEHVDTVRGEGHVGTLVYFCNSEFTGGELEVRSRGIVRSFNKLNSWVALYGDCTHSVLPVTSGTTSTNNSMYIMCIYTIAFITITEMCVYFRIIYLQVFE
jgi:hypothetical protein